MAPARFVLGTLLLRANDKAGLAHIHAAVRLDPDLDDAGRALAEQFLRANDAAAINDAVAGSRPGQAAR
jgi:hypothetical protein